MPNEFASLAKLLKVVNFKVVTYVYANGDANVIHMYIHIYVCAYIPYLGFAYYAKSIL